MEKEKFLKEKINSYLKYFNYDFTPVEFQNIFQKTLSDLNTFLAKDLMLSLNLRVTIV